MRRQLPETVLLPLKDYTELDALEQELESQQVHNELVRIPIAHNVLRWRDWHSVLSAV